MRGDEFLPPSLPSPTSSDPAQLRDDIDKVRGELADTVDALAAKADVKSRVQDKAQQLKDQVTGKAREAGAQVMASAPGLTGALR